MTKQKISIFLKQLRKTSGFSANEIVEKLRVYNINISAKTLYGYESGLSMPNADVFVTLCKIYKCDNPLSMFTENSICPNEMSLIEKYRDLDDHGKELIDFALEKEWERSTKLSQKQNIYTFNASQYSMVAEPSVYGINAAHERTDLNVTDEMREHDDSIMDSNNF